MSKNGEEKGARQAEEKSGFDKDIITRVCGDELLVNKVATRNSPIQERRTAASDRKETCRKRREEKLHKERQR